LLTAKSGIAVADVALTNDNGCSTVGSDDLKLTSKLSYANAVAKVHTAALILHEASNDNDFTALWIDVKLIDKPACASISITFLGMEVEW
jgi:hypothetical protein